VRYWADFLDELEATELMEVLRREVPWKHEEIVMFGRRVRTEREVAWYGDAGVEYRYSGVTKVGLPWNAGLKALRARLEERTGVRFNSCLLNWYADGGQGMGWHRDDEKSLGQNPVIASLSFGAERRFCFQNGQGDLKVEMTLGHGSLLWMAGETQHHWKHALPKMRRVTGPRLNLTFRQVLGVERRGTA
jgi:alkylated DNA repair dioxygenase AlkB